MSDGTNGLARFWAAVGGHVDARAEPRRARRVLTIATIERDSTGAAVTARGAIGGEGDFSIDVRGRGVREGMRIGVVGPANDPYAPLAFADLDQTDDPSAAYGDVNADLPVPSFASTPFTTVIVKSPGSVTARGSVFFNAVAERYHPDYYLLSWRLTSGPGEWRDEKVPHLGGVQECNLGSAFAPGVQIDVKLRAHYDWAMSFSVASATNTYTLASDNASPGGATALTVSTATPGALVLTASGAVDAALFAGWYYEIAATNGGATIASAVVNGPWTFPGVPPGTAGTYYVKVRPQSHSGTLGTPFPGTNHDGPHVIAVAQALDTTPPAAFDAPTLADVSYSDDQGVTHGVIRVTLPTYTFPGDYDHTDVLCTSAEGRVFLGRIQGTATTGNIACGFSTLWTVKLRGADALGNTQTAFGTAATIALPVPGVPATPGAAPTVVAIALALKVSWVLPTGTTAIELQRAPDVAGSPGTWATIPASGATHNGTTYLDIIDALTPPPYPKYHYRYRGLNGSGPGGYSASASGTPQQMHGATLVNATVDTAQIAANAITNAKIVNDAVDAAKIAAGAVGTTEIAANAVTTAKITAGAVTAAEIATGAIIAGKIAAGAVTATEIAAGAITTAKLAAGAVTANEIAADTITANQIAAGAITASEIGANAVTTAKLFAGAVTANEIAAGAVTAAKLVAGLVLADIIQTAASGKRVVMDGPNNRLAIYGVSALLALLTGDDLRFLRNGTDPRTVFDATGQKVYNDSGNLRITLDKDGLLVANVGSSANRVQLQPDAAMQLFSDDAASGLLMGYSGNPFGLFKVLVGGSVYTTEIWPNSAQGIIVANVTTHGGTPGAYLSLRPDGKLGFGTGANFADVLLARMNGSYGLGLDLDQAALHAKDIYATRNGGATGYVFLGDQSGGTRYVGYDGSNYVMPGTNLYVGGNIVLTSSQDVKNKIRPLASMRQAVRNLAPKRFRRKGAHPSERDEFGYIAEEVEAVAPNVVHEGVFTPPPTTDKDGNAVAAEPVMIKGLNPLGLLAVIHQGLSEGLAALEARVAALEARGA